MSLYRKYRPQNFTNLVGQDHIKTTLLNAVLQGNLAHAYIFCGPRGTGKTSTARLIAKVLNCVSVTEQGEPCDECEFCTAITDGSLIDVMEIDAASNRGIDEIRDLKEKIQFAPSQAKTKTYIIDEVHMLTKEAFNALLKTLEEPPERVYFVLATTEIHKVPETIISRCQRFDFKRISTKTLMTRLNYIAQKENIEADDTAVSLIARHVMGGMRDAIGLMEQLTMNGKLQYEYVRTHLGVTGHQTVEEIIAAVKEGNPKTALSLINQVHGEGYDLAAFVREILETVREEMVSGIQKDSGNENHANTEKLMRMISHFERARDMLRSTTIPQLPLEMAAISLCSESQKAESKTAELKTEKKDSTDEDLKPIFKAPKGSEKKTVSAIKKTFEEEKSQAEKKEVVTLMSLKAELPRITANLNPPSLRRSLSDATVSSVKGETVILRFRSQFHLETVNVIQNKAKIEEALGASLNSRVKILCELERISLSSDAEGGEGGQGGDHQTLAKHALEIFSGQTEEDL